MVIDKTFLRFMITAAVAALATTPSLLSENVAAC